MISNHLQLIVYLIVKLIIMHTSYAYNVCMIIFRDDIFRGDIRFCPGRPHNSEDTTLPHLQCGMMNCETGQIEVKQSS